MRAPPRPRSILTVVAVAGPILGAAVWAALWVRAHVDGDLLMPVAAVLFCGGVAVAIVGLALARLGVDGPTTVRVRTLGHGVGSVAWGGVWAVAGLRTVRAGGLRVGASLFAVAFPFVTFGLYEVVASVAGVVVRDTVIGSGVPVTLFGLETVAKRLKLVGAWWFMLAVCWWLLRGVVNAVGTAGPIDHAVLLAAADGTMALLAALAGVHVLIYGDNWDLEYIRGQQWRFLE